jgi:hypothetical protein
MRCVKELNMNPGVADDAGAVSARSTDGIVSVILDDCRRRCLRHSIELISRIPVQVLEPANFQ